MDAGRLCEEKDCCDWGDINNLNTECFTCSKSIVPKEEHDKSFQEETEYYNEYYGTELDDGDICYNCLTKIIKLKSDEKVIK
jgi:hypothetical protein